MKRILALWLVLAPVAVRATESDDVVAVRVFRLKRTLPAQPVQTDGLASGESLSEVHWASEIELARRKYWIAVVRDQSSGLSGRGFIIRRSEEPYNPGMHHLLGIPAALCLNGLCYETTFTFQSDGSETEAIARFTEVPMPMGQLDIQSERIARLALSGENPLIPPPVRPSFLSSEQEYGDFRRKRDLRTMYVIFDEPRGRVDIPATTYTQEEVFLDSGGPAGFFVSRDLPNFVLPAGAVRPVRIGPPLRNVAVVNWYGRGNLLRLSFETRGVAGERYFPLAGNPDNRPRYAIYKAGIRIASERFQYG